MLENELSNNLLKAQFVNRQRKDAAMVENNLDIVYFCCVYFIISDVGKVFVDIYFSLILLKGYEFYSHFRTNAYNSCC